MSRRRCMMRIQRFLREFRISVISLSHFTPPTPSQLHTSTFQRDHSCRHSHLYRRCSTENLLGPSRCEWGTCRHGQHRPYSGLDTLGGSEARVIRQMGLAWSLDPPTARLESGMLSLVL